MAFFRSIETHLQPSNLIVRDVETLEETQLTFLTEPSEAFGPTPIWSPDGRFIVATFSEDGGLSFDLWLVRVADGEMQRLTDTPEVNENPTDWRRGATGRAAPASPAAG